ncbi:MAG: hypothetical protein J5723_07510 [Ruminococcus sp.]|nr:hypothetical protein [Ruminococcus sp.]
MIKNILAKTGDAEKADNIEENGICNVASGLVISNVDQDTSMLRGSIQNFALQKELISVCSVLF